jgi:hypothetical protein
LCLVIEQNMMMEHEKKLKLFTFLFILIFSAHWKFLRCTGRKNRENFEL